MACKVEDAQSMPEVQKSLLEHSKRAEIMPEIGEVINGKDLGWNTYRKVIWQACDTCGKERWVYLNKGNPTCTKCLQCAHSKATTGEKRRKIFEAILDVHNKGTIEYPAIGDIRYGREIGLCRRSFKYSWLACIDCGRGRWVSLLKGGIPSSSRCVYCTPAKNNKIRSYPGRHVNNEKMGYIVVKLTVSDPFYPMVIKNTNGFVYEHRYIMAKHLNRILLPEETVHHDGGLYPIHSKENRQDNRIENLKLFPNQNEHIKYHKALEALQ